MKERRLIFSALPYANGPLHLGHMAGAYVPYDAFRRFNILMDREVISVSGSDEHGTPITVRAMKENKTPEEIAKYYHKINKEIFEKMYIEFSTYIETSWEIHKETVFNFIKRLMENGYIYKGKMVQPYCEHDKMFLPDRYITGKCPRCGYEKARGDQCENCGATLEPSELIDPVCIICKNPPVFKETDHLFFKLSALQKEMESYINSNEHWRENVIFFSKNFISSGLKDRPITRDLEWGVDAPFTEMKGKKIYVWFEALIGYLTGTRVTLNSFKDAENWWSDPEVKQYYFMGKDNIPFHSIIWPAMLIAHGNYQLPYFIAANEYLNFQGSKFSKSANVGFFMPELLDKYDPEYLRFGIYYNLPEGHDSDFSIEEFENKVNTELIDKYGNFINRALILLFKNGPVSFDESLFNEIDIEAMKIARQKHNSFIENMEKVRIRDAFREWMELARYANVYITNRKPWDACKTRGPNCSASLYTLGFLSYILAMDAQVFLPKSSEKVLNWMGFTTPLRINTDPQIPVFKVVTKPEKLYEKIQSKEAIPLDLVVAEIINAKPHPNADKLYVLDLNIGNENRTIVSGIRDSYTETELVGRKIVIIRNLKPANIRSITSNGMLLATEYEGKTYLLTPPEKSKSGDKVTLDDLEIINQEISIEEFKKYSLQTQREGNQTIAVLYHKGRKIPLKVNDENIVVDDKVPEGLKIK